MKLEENLANIIVNYSLSIRKDENILIIADTFDAINLIKKIVERIYDNKANVSVRFKSPAINAKILENISEEKLKILKKEKREDLKNYDAFIYIKCNKNSFEENKINQDVYKKINQALNKYYIEERTKKRFIYINYPTVLDAYKAKMGFDDFKSLAFDIMLTDYQKMINDIENLNALMEKTTNVRIKNSDSDITFSICGVPIMKGVGTSYIPDGDVYCEVLNNSINGLIKFNTELTYQGNIFKNVCMTFKDGYVTSICCDGVKNSNNLNEILEAGDKKVKFFSIGLNKNIKEIINNNAYDRKMLGSISLSLNDLSTLNFTLVMLKQYGGGEVYFDDKLIQKDGAFVLDELSNLNGSNN